MWRQPGDRRTQHFLDFKSISEQRAECHPIEAFVIREHGALSRPIHRTDDMLLCRREETGYILSERIWTGAWIISKAPPAGDSSGKLLEDQRQTGFDGHANQ